MKDIKIVFAGTPEFSVPILDMLNKDYNVVLVVSQPDREVGRKKILNSSPVKEYAIKNNIPVLTPNKIKLEYKEILDYKPDIIITAAYGQIIPKEILDYPKYKCINVHGSLLPKYRGGAPIQRSIINGDKKTGITIMYMNEGMDTGDMIEKEEIDINNNDNYDSLNDKLSKLGVSLLKRVLPEILNNNINSIKQDDNEATYAKIIKREDELIDFNTNSVDIYNKIRGLSTVPGAYTLFDGKALKIYESRIGNNYSHKSIGEIINIYNDGIGIATKDGEIVITDIKIEGKTRMKVREYLNGKDTSKLIGIVLGK